MENVAASRTLLSRFDDLSTCKQGDQRALHKPLLVLYATGRSQIGQKESRRLPVCEQPG